jgi:hypothetical protein
MKSLIIFIAVIAVIAILAYYYSILVKRMLEVFKPLISPFFKKIYAIFLKKDKEIAGTERTAKPYHYNNERYMDPNDPNNPYMYKRVSAKIGGMLLAVLTVFVNKWYGRVLINFYFISLVFEIVFFILRCFGKSCTGRVKLIFDSCIVQIMIGIIIYAVTGY